MSESSAAGAHHRPSRSRARRPRTRRRVRGASQQTRTAHYRTPPARRRSITLLDAPTALAACCGFDLCHKHIWYLYHVKIKTTQTNSNLRRRMLLPSRARARATRVHTSRTSIAPEAAAARSRAATATPPCASSHAMCASTSATSASEMNIGSHCTQRRQSIGRGRYAAPEHRVRTQDEGRWNQRLGDDHPISFI